MALVVSGISPTDWNYIYKYTIPTGNRQGSNSNFYRGGAGSFTPIPRQRDVNS
jgi:hypothetical protein